MSDETKNDPAGAVASGGGVVSPEQPNPDAPMTEKQAAELRQLAERLGEPFDGNLTYAQAKSRIEELKKRT